MKKRALHFVFLLSSYLLALWLYPIFRWQDYLYSLTICHELPPTYIFFYYFRHEFFLQTPDWFFTAVVPLKFLANFLSCEFSARALYILNFGLLAFLAFAFPLPLAQLIFFGFLAPLEQGAVLFLLLLSFFLLKKAIRASLFLLLAFGLSLALPQGAPLLFFVGFFRYNRPKLILVLLMLVCLFMLVLGLSYDFKFLEIFFLAEQHRQKVMLAENIVFWERPFVWLWCLPMALLGLAFLKKELSFIRFAFLLSFGLTLIYFGKSENPLWPLFLALIGDNLLRDGRQKTYLWILALFLLFPAYLKKEIPPLKGSVERETIISLENRRLEHEVLALRKHKTKILLLDLYLVPQNVALALNTKLYEGINLFSPALRDYLMAEENYARRLISRLSKNSVFSVVYSGEHPSQEQPPFSRLRNLWDRFPQAKYIALIK
ncbi:MAG: hypothetical protein NZM25_03000 [Leptospiraceae bacterium]|nr:hypothetical protein [Leptospiraceae bacterium]MDW8307237.1 hypothetical protein [Leptospiraceae bacterium]